MMELQVFLREVGMWHAIYFKPFEGPEVVPCTADMWDCIIQTAPLAYYDTLVPVLSTLVGRTVQVTAQAVAHFGGN